MIDLERVEKALNYLVNTDLNYAEAKTEVERSTYLAKHARALVHPMTEGTVDDRKSAVERATEVVKAEDRRIAAILACETLKARRETAALIVDTWRTVEASRRLGS